MSSKRLAIPLGGGVNVFDDPTAIPDGQWQKLKNLATRQTGVLGSRGSMNFVREAIPYWWHWDARTYYGVLGEASAVEDYYRWAKYIRPLKFIFDPNFGEITMVGIVTQSGVQIILDESGPAVETPVTCAEGTMFLMTLPGVMSGNGAGTQPSFRAAILGPAQRLPSIVVFNGTTYAFNGAGPGANVSPGTDSVTPVAFCYRQNNFGPANGAFWPDGACVVRNRVVYYKGPNIYWSDANQPMTVSYTGSLDINGNIVPSTANPASGAQFPVIGTRDIYLGGEELEDITAIAEVSTSADGSPVQSVAMAFTSTHAYMLLGEPLATAEGGNILGSLQINKLNVQAGCVSQATITRTPYGTLWCGLNDVWFMPVGSLPIRVGTSIRPMLEAQPLGLRWKMHAEYEDGFYRLSMFSPGQGPSTYSPCGMQMWLDLRRGPPQNHAEAQWFGPQVWNNTDGPDINGDRGGEAGTWCMARDSRATGDGKLYSLQPFAMFGWSHSISGLSLCRFDQFSGRDTAAPQGATSLVANLTGTFNEGDVVAPLPNLTDFRTPLYDCIQGGYLAVQPDWFAPSGTGQIGPGAGLAIFVCRYWDGTHVLPGYDCALVQGDNTVAFDAVGKELMLGDPMVDKLLDGAEVSYTTGDRTQVTQRSHIKQDIRPHIMGLTTEMVDNVLGSYTGERVWQTNALTPDPAKRFHGKSMTWEMTQNPGYVITAGVNDTIRMQFSPSPAITLTIPAGYYVNITAVLDTVVAAALVQTFTLAHNQGSGISAALVGFICQNAYILTIYTDSRLANLLGYSTQQGATAGGVPFVYTYGYNSPALTLAPDMQFGGINLKYRLFGRRPM